MKTALPKIVWLASYPKSGNTWFRAFLTALMNDSKVDINGLYSDGIFSSRELFEHFTDIDSRNLFDDEVRELQPQVFTCLNANHKKAHLFIKIHDAYIFNRHGNPLVPSAPSKAAIYFIRNPLDLAGSMANFKGISIDRAIRMLNMPDTMMAGSNAFNTHQLNQSYLGWSGHVSSWTGELPFPVLVIRYEDMLTDTVSVFKKALRFIGMDVPDERVKDAVRMSGFQQLQRQETEHGFNEKVKANKFFFRKGQSGNWVDELTESQVQNIMENHGEVMNLFGYSAQR